MVEALVDVLAGEKGREDGGGSEMMRVMLGGVRKCKEREEFVRNVGEVMAMRRHPDRYEKALDQ